MWNCIPFKFTSEYEVFKFSDQWTIECQKISQMLSLNSRWKFDGPMLQNRAKSRLQNVLLNSWEFLFSIALESWSKRNSHDDMWMWTTIQRLAWPRGLTGFMFIYYCLLVCDWYIEDLYQKISWFLFSDIIISTPSKTLLGLQTS